MKPKSKSRRRPSLLRRFLGWFTMDRLRSVWGFLSEHVLDPMAHFFAHCFRIDDSQERRTSPVQDWGYFPSDYCATPFLRFRDEYGVMEDLESGGVVDLDRSDPSDNDAVNLEDQAKFLKACGALSRSPAELKKHHESSRVSMSSMSTISDNHFGSAGSYSYHFAKPHDQAIPSPVQIAFDMPKEIMEENTVSSPEYKPAQTTASDFDLSAFKNVFSERTVSPIPEKCDYAVNVPDKAAESPDVLQKLAGELPMNEKSVSSSGYQSASSGRSNQSSTPSDLGRSDRRPSQGRSVRFELNETPDSDRSGSNYSGKSQFGSPEEGNKYQLSGQGHSPYPTPLILSKDMQTPGTVFASAKKQGGAVAGKVRSQFVYPVEDFTHWNALKADHIGADP